MLLFHFGIISVKPPVIDLLLWHVQIWSCVNVTIIQTLSFMCYDSSDDVQLYGEKLLLLKFTRRVGAPCETESHCVWKRVLQPNIIIVYLCLFSSMAVCHFCFCLCGNYSRWQRHRLCWWLLKLALACSIVRLCTRTEICVYVHKCLLLCLWSVRTWNVSGSVYTFLPSCAYSLVSGKFSPPMVGLSQPDGWSQPVSERWQLAGLASPGHGSGSCPLTAPDGWHVYNSPTHELASWKLLVYRKINDVSQHVLMKCKLYEPHPSEMTPELISVLKEAATLSPDWIFRPFQWL